MTPKEAILATVRRWARIAKTGIVPPGCCELCYVARYCCSSCIYVAVFKTCCYLDFPVLDSDEPLAEHASPVLRRAMTLARRYGLRAEALAIIREVFRR